MTTQTPDTQTIIAQLRDAGMTYEAIGEEVGVSMGTAWRWGDGKSRPTNKVLMGRLRHLWEQRCRRE